MIIWIIYKFEDLKIKQYLCSQNLPTIHIDDKRKQDYRVQEFYVNHLIFLLLLSKLSNILQPQKIGIPDSGGYDKFNPKYIYHSKSFLREQSNSFGKY
jgi:hypothetical protein